VQCAHAGMNFFNVWFLVKARKTIPPYIHTKPFPVIKAEASISQVKIHQLYVKRRMLDKIINLRNVIL